MADNTLPPLQIDWKTLRTWAIAEKPMEIIDIRRRQDFEAWHMPGARHLDVYDAIHTGSPGELATYAPSDGAEVVAVCYVGQTSQAAVDYLRSRGIHAYSLEGGMHESSKSWDIARLELKGVEIVQFRRNLKGCLSYLAISDNQAILIDPSLDAEEYAQYIESTGINLQAAIDTHIHADHISRGPTIAMALEVPYYLPKNTRSQISYMPIDEGFSLQFGSSILRAIQSPGHTLESICLLIEEKCIFTGDTLFLSGFGRPDLVRTSEEALANGISLHGSLFSLLGLSDELMIFPGHASESIPFGAGPLSKPLGEVRPQINIGNSAQDFAGALLSNIPPTPDNHHQIIRINETGILPFGDTATLEAGPNRCAAQFATQE